MKGFFTDIDRALRFIAICALIATIANHLAGGMN